LPDIFLGPVRPETSVIPEKLSSSRAALLTVIRDLTGTPLDFTLDPEPGLRGENGDLFDNNLSPRRGRTHFKP